MVFYLCSHSRPSRDTNQLYSKKSIENRYP
nr:MAG TPA: hypothetical protein [Caudoviricetes sp.]DAV01824.1 MAG TPA: hypothetical protein [Caudoviricetes sp.]